MESDGLNKKVTMQRYTCGRSQGNSQGPGCLTIARMRSVTSVLYGTVVNNFKPLLELGCSSSSAELHYRGAPKKLGMQPNALAVAQRFAQTKMFAANQEVVFPTRTRKINTSRTYQVCDIYNQMFVLRIKGEKKCTSVISALFHSLTCSGSKHCELGR